MAKIAPIDELMQKWFCQYGSHVILHRAVPHLHDGLKPSQRRVLHSLKELEDGRYNKVANAVGNTLKYHPHGDASVFETMVGIGQKGYLIDWQGNWGNTLTGDGPAAPRYIEGRLAPLAKEFLFNPKTTEWQDSYDGRNKEPVALPAKLPLLLIQGTEGIARAIADSSAFSIAGGGDTLAAIAKYGIDKEVGYISTGGGAFLEVLEGKTLPAFEILHKRAGA